MYTHTCIFCDITLLMYIYLNTGGDFFVLCIVTLGKYWTDSDIHVIEAILLFTALWYI